VPAVASAARCRSCGNALPSGARFCPECGQPVAPVATPGAKALAGSAGGTLEGERKFITVMFADLKGALDLVAERDPEEARKLLDPLLEHVCEAVEKYGGTVNQVMPDGIMALFGAPISWEDHAVRACNAALSIQDLARHYGEEIRRTHGVPVEVRVGLNSGEVVLSTTGRGRHLRYSAAGVAVHVAARMQQMAKPGSILATVATVRLADGYVDARPTGPMRVKGFAEPLEAAEIGRMVAPRSRFDRAPTRALTPFTGRSAEQEALLAAVSDIVDDRAGRVAVIVGEAGIGKSRLVHEFLRTIARRNVLALDGGAAPHGSGSGYRPGLNILRQYFNLGDDDDLATRQEKIAGRIVALDGDSSAVGVPLLALMNALPDNHRFFELPLEERRQRVFVALMWLARHMSEGRPLVLAYEDLQWASSDTHDFLAAFVRELPPATLLVFTHRPDYDASWLETRERLELRLDGLPGPAIRRIIGDLLGDDPSLAALVVELAAKSGGNPLFVEEYVRSMVDAGVLVGQPGHYRLGAKAMSAAIPPTVRGVLAARIDRLTRDDKSILQILAAIGGPAGVNLAARVARVPLDEARKSLRRLEMAGLLVERVGAAELAYEFRHALTQAVAYETLLAARRRELHRAILDALSGGGRVDELARHAVQAEAWDDAAAYLRDAGRLAAREFASMEAIAHFERALEALARLPATRQSKETTFDIHCELRNALLPLGDHPRLFEVLRSAEAIARDLGDEERHAQVLSFLSNYYDNVGKPELALEKGKEALVLAERVGASSLLAVGTLGVGEIHRTLGDFASARDYLRRAITLIGPRREHETFGEVGLPSVRARSHLAWTLAELGDFDAARTAANEALMIADASHDPYTVCHGCLALGGVRVRAGEFETAITVLARGHAESEHVPLVRPSIAADLGVAYARSGKLAEGLAHASAAVDAATGMGRKSRLALIMVKCAETRQLAGERDEALRLVTSALALATEQHERGNEVYARHRRAEILAEHAEESDEAAREFESALGLANALGMRVLAAHCRAGLGRVLARRGDTAGAEAHLAAAAAMYDEMGMRYWLVRLTSETAALG
jgi:class 3 adenylate cyclase